MDLKRPYKISLSSFVAVGIALGAYYTGYAKQGAPSVVKTNEVVPTFLGKLDPNSHYAVAVTRPSEFGITPDEVVKIKANASVALAEYFVAQKADWQARMAQSQLAEEGKFLPSTGRGNVSGVAELLDGERNLKPLEQANSKLAVVVSKVIGNEKNSRIVAKFDHDVESNSGRYDVLFDYATINSIGLSQPQKNQFSLITAFIAQSMNHSNVAKSLVYDEVAPKIEEYRKMALSASQGEKDFYFPTASAILSPIQEFRLDTIYRNRQYVQP